MWFISITYLEMCTGIQMLYIGADESSMSKNYHPTRVTVTASLSCPVNPWRTRYTCDQLARRARERTSGARAPRYHNAQRRLSPSPAVHSNQPTCDGDHPRKKQAPKDNRLQATQEATYGASAAGGQKADYDECVRGGTAGAPVQVPGSYGEVGNAKIKDNGAHHDESRRMGQDHKGFSGL